MLATRKTAFVSSALTVLLSCANANEPAAPRPPDFAAAGASSMASGESDGNPTAGANAAGAGTLPAGGSHPASSAGANTSGAGGGQPEPEPELGDPSFHDLAASATTLGVYDTLVVTFRSDVPYQNPFDQDDIKADLLALAPDGSSVVMPASR